MDRHVPLTIINIAEICHVSVSTVSRILNNKPDVAEKTRQRVLQKIHELGYIPHVQAQQLASGRSRSIALLFSRDYADFTQVELDFIAGIAIACAEGGYFFNLNVNPVTENSLRTLCRSRQVDGVILMEVNAQDWRVNFLREHDYPFMMIGSCANNDGLSFIDMNMESGTLKTINYLVELGHKNIAFLSYPTVLVEKKYTPAISALVGYEKAIVKFGLHRIQREVEMDQQAMMEATSVLLNEYPEISAIVSFNGISIIGVFKAIYQKKKRIPDDFSIIGFGNEQTAQLTIPSLTSITIPARKMGFDAAKILINKLDGVYTHPVQSLSVPELIIRGSSGVVNR